MKKFFQKNRMYKIIDYGIFAFVFCSVIIFILLPFFCVLKEAFFKNGSISFAAFRSVFKKSGMLLRNSFVVALLTSLLTALASIATAVFFFTDHKKLQKLIFAILSISMISPPFVTALTYINLFGRRGMISYYLFGISANPYGMLGIVLMQSLSNFSLGSLILIGFLKNMDRFEIDSARNLGANTNAVICDIILPKIFPAIKSLLLLTFFRSLADFGTPAVIGGACNVMATESYFALIAHGDIQRSAILNIMILLPALVIFLFYRKSFKNVSTVSKGQSASELQLKRRGIVYYGISIIALFFLLWITVQYCSIILSAFTRMKKGKLIFSIQNFIETQEFIGGSTIRSIRYSVIAAVGTTVIGFFIAYYAQIRKSRLIRPLNFIATLPYIIPGTFFGLGYLLAFKSPPLALTGTASIVVLNMLFKQTPFSVNIATAAMSDINRDVLNAVRDLGGSRINEVGDAVVPLSLHGIALSFLNAFKSSMTTMGSIIFLVYPGQKVLTLVMFDAIQSAKYNVGSVIALLIIAICVSMNLLYMPVLRKLETKR